MSKRRRVMSPASENTLINSLVESGLDVIDDDLSESFLETISESESDSELGEEFLDDTDEDPDCTQCLEELLKLIRVGLLPLKKFGVLLMMLLT
ncbi:hypothetical protein J6590_008780 [Homalodisca vitripennis]|nr:hypothetical protein J6590_008780 [Homalodisca vitripennis]